VTISGPMPSPGRMAIFIVHDSVKKAQSAESVPCCLRAFVV